MEKALPPTAVAMRERFRAIPKADREANQPFSIRIWRGLSWLERAESAGEDLDGQFISLWIAFNAVYGCLEDGVNAPDHANWQVFLARIVKSDAYDVLGKLLWAEQLPVFRLIDNQYLFRPFWAGRPDALDKLHHSRQLAMQNLNRRNTLGVLEELFERLYVVRQQVFHGAATRGSKLNRGYLKSSTRLLSLIVPAVLDSMISAGPKVDWGDVCFPPITDGGGR